MPSLIKYNNNPNHERQRRSTTKWTIWTMATCEIHVFFYRIFCSLSPAVTVFNGKNNIWVHFIRIERVDRKTANTHYTVQTHTHTHREKTTKMTVTKLEKESAKKASALKLNEENKSTNEINKWTKHVMTTTSQISSTMLHYVPSNRQRQCLQFTHLFDFRFSKRIDWSTSRLYMYFFFLSVLFTTWMNHLQIQKWTKNL